MKSKMLLVIAPLFALAACSDDGYQSAREVRQKTEAVRAESDSLKLNNCRACHAERQKMVGPSFQTISRKMQEEGFDESPRVLEQYANKVMKGSSGRYGVAPMPPNPAVDRATAEHLLFQIRRIGE